MIADTELDRILRDWLAEGGERAPERDVDAALARVATASQRHRARLMPLIGAVPRWGWVAAAVLLGSLLAVGIGSALLQDRDVPPLPPPTTGPDTVVTPLRVVATEDWSVDLSIPESWAQVGDDIPEYRDFGGTKPEGHLSASHESPYQVTLCTPDCTAVDVEMTIPYDASTQLRRLRSGIAEVAGSDAWADLPADILPEIVDGAWLDTTGPGPEGRDWRRVYVAGLVARNVVGIAWSQPADVFDEALMRSVLGEMTLTAAPEYSDGDLLPTESTDWSMPISGMWQWEEQPTLDGTPMSGVRRWGDGRVMVSIGTADGVLGWCDPDCRELTGMTSLEVLETGIRGDRVLSPAEAATLDGEPALAFGTADPVERRYVVAMHDGRPVAVAIDVGEWEVAPGIVDEMVAGFAFMVPPTPAPVAQTFVVADGLAELGLPDGWAPSPDANDTLVTQEQTLTVRVGGADGTIVTCDEPAAPWELCREIRAASLDELAAAVGPAPIDDHGVGPPEGRVESGRIGGEPSVVTRIQAYEYPAKSGQEVVYIAVFHDGRPYLIRMRTHANEVVGLESVIDGFRFLD
jgi:hypothetical protein